MVFTFDTHSASFTHLVDFSSNFETAIVSKKYILHFSHTKAYVTKFDLGVKLVKVNPRS